MPKAGDYNNRLTWLTIHRTVDETTGEWKGTHDYGPKLWASVSETNGRREVDKGAEQTGADAEIRVRNYPAISALDLLLDEYQGFVWHIVSVINGDHELIIDAYRNDELEDHEIDGSSS